MTIAEIKDAIKHLDEKRFVSFSDWFQKIEDERWDKELESDITRGKLDKIADKALRQYETGKCREL